MRHQTLKFQEKSDKLIDNIFLRFIPRSVKPNHVTVIRFILVPIVYFLLIDNQINLALWVFVIAACTDFIDGAMARTRNQITDLGKMIDPAADKLLILVVLIFLGYKYLIVKIFIFVIILELLAILFGAFFSFVAGRPVGANVFGKIKMILQSAGVVLFLIGLMAKNLVMINISEYILFISLIFAIISGVVHIKRKVGHGNRSNE